MGMDNDDYIEPEDDYNEEGEDGDDGSENEEIVEFFLLLEQQLKDSKFKETAKILDDIESNSKILLIVLFQIYHLCYQLLGPIY